MLAVARRADALVDAINNLDAARPARTSRRPRRQRRPGDPHSQGTVKALQAQLDSADRIIKVARDTQDKVRLLDARLDEAVARAVELSIRAEDVGELGGVGGDIDGLVNEMERCAWARRGRRQERRDHAARLAPRTPPTPGTAKASPPAPAMRAARPPAGAN